MLLVGDAIVYYQHVPTRNNNHPDRNQGDVELFKRAALAYEFLSDTDKRRGYDSQLRRTVHLHVPVEVALRALA